MDRSEQSAFSMPRLPSSTHDSSSEGGEIKRPACLRYRRFALNNVEHQRALALGRPVLDLVFHLHAHVFVVGGQHLSMFSVGHYIYHLD